MWGRLSDNLVFRVPLNKRLKISSWGSHPIKCGFIDDAFLLKWTAKCLVLAWRSSNGSDRIRDSALRDPPDVIFVYFEFKIIPQSHHVEPLFRCGIDRNTLVVCTGERSSLANYCSLREVSHYLLPIIVWLLSNIVIDPIFIARYLDIIYSASFPVFQQYKKKTRKCRIELAFRICLEQRYSRLVCTINVV